MVLTPVINCASSQPVTYCRTRSEIFPHLLGQSTGDATAVEHDMVAYAKRALQTTENFRMHWLSPEYALVLGTAAPCRLVTEAGKKIIDARDWVQAKWALTSPDAQTNAALRVNRLINIKSTFGLSNADLARVCRVSRTQLYKWLDPNGDTLLNGTNWERLANLSRLAEDWNLLSVRPARQLLNEQLADGKTLLEALSAQTLNQQMIRKGIKQLITLFESKPKRRDELLSQQGIKPAIRPGQLAWDE